MSESISLAANLVKLSKEYQTQEPAQAAAIRKAFKNQSLNDCTRTIVYLLEVVSSNSAFVQQVKNENDDLKELLKLNNIALDQPETEESASEA